MNIAILEQSGMVDGEYAVKISFGNNNPTGGYDGHLRIKTEDATKPLEVVFEVSITGDERFGADELAWAYFSYFMDDMEEGDTMINLPKPTLKLTYADDKKRGGKYGIKYELTGYVEEPGDNPSTPAVETDFVGEFKEVIEFEDGTFRQIQ